MLTSMGGVARPGVPGCRVDPRDIRLLASAEDPGTGGSVEWWSAPTEGGGSAEIVVGPGGGGGSCGGLPDPTRADDLWWSGGSGSDSRVIHAGRVPSGAAQARLTFGDHQPVVVDANDRGYFLIALAESACCEWSFPDLLEALDAEGEVIASESP